MSGFGRRKFLASLGLAGMSAAATPLAAGGQESMALRVAVVKTVSEGLMFEHSIIQRLMGIYEECADRLAGGRELPPGVVTNAGVLADEFVENYHEAWEEGHLYAPFRGTGALTDVIRVMTRQHRVGRRLVQRTIFLSGKESGEAAVRDELAELCRAYPRMYRAHAAREDTVLLPNSEVIGGAEMYAALHRAMMAFRRSRLGTLNLNGVLSDVKDLEDQLGIRDLDHYTAEMPEA